MDNQKIHILVIEDDSLTMQTTKRLLSPYGKVHCAKSEVDAHNMINSHPIDLAFIDLNLNGEMSGLKIISYCAIKRIYPIVLSGEDAPYILEEAFKNGAIDFLSKPFAQDKLSMAIGRFFNNRQHLKFEQIINKSFITKNPALTAELYKIKNLSISNKPIFINGETGTGKRVVAHLVKTIIQAPVFIEVNCSQFNDELFASELFGHKKGAFTGANENKIGLLEKADNGIIFLDEIHALSSKSQKTLLKAIEEKEFYPVGSTKKIKSNFRVLSATCEDINTLIEKNLFRTDLYARISTFEISIPPLRKRNEDISLLFVHFISKQLINILITKEAKTVLENYSWPRNTREIQDLVENWVINGHRLITPELLPANITNNIVKSNQVLTEHHLDLVEEHGLSNFLLLFKKEIIQEMTKRHNGIQKYASDAMKASNPNISNFMKQHKSKSLLNRSTK
jgi:DNA-binding NtrC family response regulator